VNNNKGEHTVSTHINNQHDLNKNTITSKKKQRNDLWFHKSWVVSKLGSFIAMYDYPQGEGHTCFAEHTFWPIRYT